MMASRQVVTAIVALVLTAVLGAGVWLLSATPGSLVNDEPPRQGPTAAADREPIVVAVDQGESAGEIGKKLEDAGVIESERLFRVLAGLMGVSNDLAAGEYEFERGETALSAVWRISHGLTASLIVTIPEGLRLEEIGELLAERGVASADEFRRALGDQYEASFLSQLPPGSSLEGFLFPATYGFTRDETGHGVVQKMLDAFDNRYRERVRPLLQPGGRSLRDIVVLASIVEREARLPEERPTIASVFANRLEQGIPLQADPAVQYALAGDPASVQQFGYWKTELSLADLAISSPYNTYVNVGLPPGPIANPGLDALLAAAQPAETNYLFFVARDDGSHIFAATLEEHRRNVCQIDPDRPECP